MADQTTPRLAPLTPAEPETCISAYAAAIVRTSAQVQTVEAANDAYVALGRFDREEAPTVVEERDNV